MLARQFAKLDMYRIIKDHCESNPTIVSSVTAFQNAVNAFKAKIALIDETQQQEKAPLAGIAVDKSVLKQTLSRRAAGIADIIYAYAAATGNNTLKEAADFPVSRLLRAKSSEIAALCGHIHAKAVEHKQILEKDFGLTTQKLADLQTAIDDFNAATTKPKTAIGNRKTLKANLRAYFKEADEILDEQMDKLVTGFKDTAPDFVSTYENLRLVQDPITTTTQLKGTVTAASDEKPVKGATVTIIETGKTATTNTRGNFTFKPLDPAVYTIKVTATGFEDFQLSEFDVKLGAVNSLDVAMANN